MSGRSNEPLADPDKALADLLARLEPVETQTIDLAQAGGRILAEPLRSDRPSPPADVSAMDGYALRLSDLHHQDWLEVAAQVKIGQPPPLLPPGRVVRIFTGGAVPNDAEAVIRREDVEETPQSIRILPGINLEPGTNIRRQGENLPANQPVLEPGEPITPAAASALAAFGAAQPRVYRKLRIALITTGDELLPPEAQPSPWQLRDSNGPQLQAMLAPLRWVTLDSAEGLAQAAMRATDEPGRIEAALRRALEHCDVVMLTGGVSMGDYDYVPQVVKAVGGDIVFHKLAQRPGKPMLGAVGPEGQAILGLPGNPVSVLVTARRLGAAVLRKRAGWREPTPPMPTVRLTNPGEKRLGLWWSRLVRLNAQGDALPVTTKGSGDLVAAAQSHGFVLIPPDQVGQGPWPYYAWSIV